VSQQLVDDCGQIINDLSRSAELIKYFNSTNDIIYIARFKVRERDEGGTIVGSLCQIRIPGHPHLYDRPDHFSNLCIQDILDIPEDSLCGILSADSKKETEYSYELDAITWISAENLKVANRYPDILITDATCKTNSSNRPLIFVCGVDSMQKTIIVSSSLSSNESRDTFVFMLENLRVLYGRKWCQRVSVFLSDGANEITGAIDNAILSGLFPSCSRFLCHHHAVNTKALKDITFLKNAFEIQLRSMLVALLFMAFRKLETEDEFKLFFRAMQTFMLRMRDDEKKLSLETFMKFDEFVKAVLANVAYLSNVYAQHVFHCDIRTSGRVECENGIAKDTGVNSSTSVVKVAIIDVTRNLNRAFENDLRLQREALVQPIDTKGYSEIASQVTLSAWKLFSSQVEVHSEYEVRRVADNPLQFEVISKKSVAKKGNIELQLFKFETLGSESIPIELPKFHRIRRITVQEGFLICSCPFFSWYGIPCRHMLAVNKGRVQIADFYIRWTTEYARGMLDDVLREETITMSPGAISQASREDFPSSSCSSSEIQETERSHDEPPEIPDATDQPTSEEDDQQSSEEDASSERDSFEVIGRKKPRLDEHERFLESERLISE
jgi:hypothetical protein